ncbi:MAG: phage portal protein [Acidobacteria bacterium]|jgi:capsid protein|nr:MAG: phage portal protein [Acidobacteriota bacterium]
MRTLSKILDAYGRPANFSALYDGAKPSRHRSYIWPVDTDSKDTLDNWTRIELLSAARYLFANIGFVKGAIRGLARYSFGCGWIPQSLAVTQTARDAYETFWADWSNIADTSGQWTYGDLQRMQSVAVDVDGDIGRNYVTTTTGFPKLELVRAHRIKNPNDADKTKWTDGVRISARGSPVAYSVAVGDGNFKTFPVEQFALVRDADSPDEYRGKTGLHHGINSLRDICEILIAEKQGVKINSSLALAIKLVAQAATDQAPVFGATQPVTTDDGQTLTLERILAGQIPRLQEGEDLWSHTSDRPSPTFTGFLDYLLRDVAVGLGLPWEFVWDPSKLGGSTNRLAIGQAAWRFEERQTQFIPHANRDWQFVIGAAITRGDVPADKDWFRVKWQMPRKISVDAGRDSAANLNEMKFGTRTHAEDAGERGAFWEDERAQIERETSDIITRADRIAKATKQPFELCLGLLQQRSPNPAPLLPPAPSTPGGSNPTTGG